MMAVPPSHTTLLPLGAATLWQALVPIKHLAGKSGFVCLSLLCTKYCGAVRQALRRQWALHQANLQDMG